MSDVAARAGVSHQTVSRVINGSPNVAPPTRERVLEAIAELGYRPNIMARALVTGSTRTIGFVTVNINQYGPAQTLVGLEQAARSAGYSLSVTVLDDATAGAMRDALAPGFAPAPPAPGAPGPHPAAPAPPPPPSA